MSEAAQVILKLQTFYGPVSDTARSLPLYTLQAIPVTVRKKL